MRISDWRSDVCSSDLVEDDGVVAGGGDGGTRFVDGADGIGGETGPFETAADQLAQAVFVLDDQDAHDECRSRKWSVRHVFDGRAILGLEAYPDQDMVGIIPQLALQIGRAHV